MISKKKYQNLWLAFVQITAIDGYNFLDLVDFEKKPAENFSGGFVWILVKAKTINEALALIPRGLDEKHFKVVFVDQICYLQTMIEDKSINKEIIEEADWFIHTQYVFKICNGIWAYSNDNY
jgi:hypothetical protein